MVRLLLLLKVLLDLILCDQQVKAECFFTQILRITFYLGLLNHMSDCL